MRGINTGRAGRVAVPAAIAAAILLSIGAAERDRIQEVVVTNFPELQQVSGQVSVEGVIPHGSLAVLKDLEVPPVGREDVTRFVGAGTVTTDGFSGMVLSLTGQPKGTTLQEGRVGALLIPDVEPVTRAFEERGQLQFPFEVRAGVPAGTAAFFSEQPRFVVGFPRYRVFLYNTTDKTVTATLYAYLTN